MSQRSHVRGDDSGAGLSRSANDPEFDLDHFVRRHVRFGLWVLLISLTLGIVLETFHGLKLQWYLADKNETRHLVWRLAHAHGTLLGMVLIVFALTARHVPTRRLSVLRRFASPCLLASSLLLPGGFFLGGLWFFAGDPGLGVFLVPPGAALLLLGVAATAISLRREKAADEPPRHSRH